METQIQEAQRMPTMISPKMPTLKYIITKQLRITVNLENRKVTLNIQGHSHKIMSRFLGRNLESMKT